MAHRNGTAFQKILRIFDEFKQQIVDLYLNGVSVRKLADEYGQNLANYLQMD